MYSIRNTVFDIYVMGIFGVIGYILRKVSLDPGPMILAFVLGPMWRYKREELRGQPAGKQRFLLYFACLGAGFMLVRVGLTQEFVLFLGHPKYALAVVSFSIAFASALGSFFAFGIEIFSDRALTLIPWCWAVNGAISVFASVFAIA